MPWAQATPAHENVGAGFK